MPRLGLKVKVKRVTKINKTEYELMTEDKQETGSTAVPKQIKVTDDVYQDLTKLGKKNETYSQIIRRVLDFYFEHQQGK